MSQTDNQNGPQRRLEAPLPTVGFDWPTLYALVDGSPIAEPSEGRGIGIDNLQRGLAGLLRWLSEPQRSARVAMRLRVLLWLLSQQSTVAQSTLARRLRVSPQAISRTIADFARAFDPGLRVAGGRTEAFRERVREAQRTRHARRKANA